MPIVQAGKQFTKADLQQLAGNVAQMLIDHAQNGTDFASQLQTWTDQDLLDLGLEQPQVDAIKGFYIGDLPTIADALRTSVWLRQLVGLGV